MNRDFVGIYKANKSNNGAVAQFKLGQKRDCMFLELAKQVRPMDDAAPYDWDNKINVKLGESDIGKILALLNGFLPPAEAGKDDLMLYHETAKGSKIIKLKRQDRGYYMTASMKEKVDGGVDKSLQVAIPIGWDEAELIKIALTRGYSHMLGW